MKHKGGLSQHVRWLLIAVAVQAAIGAGMIPIRYLWVSTGLPSLAVIAVSDLIVFSLMSWRTLPRINRMVCVQKPYGWWLLSLWRGRS
ncbi:MAG: hypothetical protein SVR81_00550 [Chloroflexota bacterium]|nr:hypothetical protein [Chloroflexota bacterium]